MGRWQSGQSQQAVNLPPSGYGGSNPPLPTNLFASGTEGSFGLVACAKRGGEKSGEVEWIAWAGVTQW